MGHDVGQVIGAARLQIGVAYLVGHLDSCGDVVTGEFDITRRRFDPSREQKGAGPFQGRGQVAGRVECGEDPLGASARSGGSSCRRRTGSADP